MRSSKAGASLPRHCSPGGRQTHRSKYESAWRFRPRPRTRMEPFPLLKMWTTLLRSVAEERYLERPAWRERSKRPASQRLTPSRGVRQNTQLGSAMRCKKMCSECPGRGTGRHRFNPTNVRSPPKDRSPISCKTNKLEQIGGRSGSGTGWALLCAVHRHARSCIHVEQILCGVPSFRRRLRF